MSDQSLRGRVAVVASATVGYRGNLFYDLAKNAVIRLARHE